MNTWECGTPRSSGNAFQILYQPRAIADSKTAPKKRGPKRTRIEWAVIGLETPEQRKERQALEKANKEAKILRRNSHSDIGRNFPGQADRTNVITGRRISARHQ